MSKGAARQEAFAHVDRTWSRERGVEQVAEEENAEESKLPGRKEGEDFNGPVHTNIYPRTVAIYNRDSTALLRRARAAPLLPVFIASHARCPALRCVRCVPRPALHLALPLADQAE